MEKAIIDVSSGQMDEVVFIPLTPEEIAEREQIALEQETKYQERLQAEAEAAAKKAAAEAKLATLGLTSEDLRALGL